MALKIIRSTEPISVTRVVTNIYSPPGLGKTTLACTAEKPILLDFDAGSHRAKNRPDTVRIERWADVVGMAAEDFASYKTAIVDTAGRALDVLTPALIASDPKFGNKSGALSLQGFGALRSTFIGWLNMLKSFGLDVILVCHSDEQKKGDEMIERLDVQGGTRQEIYKSADQMGRIYLENGKRILNFNPSDVAFGKNPGELPALEVPDYRTTPDFFAQVLVKVKAKLNELTAAQAAAAAFQADWKAKFDAAANADDFTALMDPVRALDATTAVVIRPMMIQAAKAKGFTVSADKTKFEPIPGAAAPAKAEPPKDETGTATAAASAASTAPETTDQKTDSPTSATPAEDKGDAPSEKELAAGAPAAATGQGELPVATPTKRGKGKAA